MCSVNMLKQIISCWFPNTGTRSNSINKKALSLYHRADGTTCIGQHVPIHSCTMYMKENVNKESILLITKILINDTKLLEILTLKYFYEKVHVDAQAKYKMKKTLFKHQHVHFVKVLHKNIIFLHFL